MKVNIEFEFPDDFEPCTLNCFPDCPLSSYDMDKDESYCNFMYYVNDEDLDMTCIIEAAIKAKNEDGDD